MVQASCAQRGGAFNIGTCQLGGMTHSMGEVNREQQLQSKIGMLQEGSSAVVDHETRRHSESNCEHGRNEALDLLETQLANVAAQSSEWHDEYEQLSLMLAQKEQDILNLQFEMIHAQNYLRDQPQLVVGQARQ